MTNGTIMLSRQQLYDEIWQVSVAGVARKYNLNYSKLIAKCREADIPFPSSGYWIRKSLGKDVTGEVVALPPSDNENVELLLAGAKVEKKKKAEHAVVIEEPKEEEISAEEVIAPADSTVLPFLEDGEKRRVLRVASELCIREKRRLHGQLIKYRNSMAEWKRKEKESQNRNSESVFDLRCFILCCGRVGREGECRPLHENKSRCGKNSDRRGAGPDET